MSSHLILRVEDIKKEGEEWLDTRDQNPSSAEDQTGAAHTKPKDASRPPPATGVTLQACQIKCEPEAPQSTECGRRCDAAGPTGDTAARKSKRDVKTKTEFGLEDGVWACLQCDRTFGAKHLLKKHESSHKPTRPHSCAECSVSFRRLAHLKEHGRVHTGEKPFSCSECGKSFGHLKTLKNHRVVHTGEKPYSCPECGKSFGRCSRLRSHERIHAQEKPHTCELCGNRFRLLETFKRHLRVHSGEKPYSCPECGRTFTHGHRLKSHQQSHARKKYGTKGFAFENV